MSFGSRATRSRQPSRSRARQSIFSGLLRMSDLITMQSNLSIPLYIVAPSDRRDKVVQEVNRPTFDRLSQPMRKMCQFISFEELRRPARAAATRSKVAQPHILELLLGKLRARGRVNSRLPDCQCATIAPRYPCRALARPNHARSRGKHACIPFGTIHATSLTSAKTCLTNGILFNELTITA